MMSKITKADGLKRQTARKLLTCGPSGGLVGIDQEVVTLRGLYGNSRVWDR